MAKILKFPIKNRFNLALIISNKIKAYKKKSRQVYFKKVFFLCEQAYQYFCDFHTARIENSVDFHPDYYARKDTLGAILDIIIDRRVQQCFDSRVAELIEQGRYEELKAHGIKVGA